VGALDAGADDYLTKPFVFEEADTLCHLGLRLRTRLQRRRRVRAAPSKQSRSSRRTVPDPDRPRCRLPLQRHTKPLAQISASTRKLQDERNFISVSSWIHTW
jgi:DNA-binding response OmpR family regulator